MNAPSDRAADLSRLIESAGRLGVELDEAEALQWLTAMAVAEGDGSDISVDEETGVFGHRVSMLDFSPADLARFRAIGRIVEFYDEPGVVDTALALSGSAAQSKIQTYPGDCDYFERVNIHAPTREEACAILARLMREKALSALQGPTHQLIEVKFGSYPCDVVRDGRTLPKGSPIAWRPDEIVAGRLAAETPEGDPLDVTWDSVSADPGWCKLDWVVADPPRSALANASNMLDVTWEAPDGSITPLDGYLDPYFQEVYLDADSIPIFSKLVHHVSPDALDEYVSLMETEVKKYLTKDLNYGKAAKRMYNIFRLTGRHAEAAFVRELFDEPAALLYQVWSLLRALDEACNPDSSITMDQVSAQADRLILDVVSVLEGDAESEIIKQLLVLRNMIAKQKTDEALSAETGAARQRVINVVNTFFHERLMALPGIEQYICGMQSMPMQHTIQDT